ncbi:MAG: MoaD/ThiS family protein [Desulfohalobiaceae bacterium]
MQRLGIDTREVKLIFVNNKSASRTTLLEEGDTVGLFPAVGGG